VQTLKGSSPESKSLVPPILKTHLIALVGAVSFLLLNAPLPWLFGPLTSCLITAVLGFELKVYKPLGDGMRTILGVAVGAAVTPAFFYSLPSLAPTLLIVPVFTVLIGLVGVIYFRKIYKYDFYTAYFSSMPGGVQDMIVFAEEAGANIRSVSLIHATRILVIVVILPIILSSTWEVNLTNPPGMPLQEFELFQLMLLFISAILGWRIAKKLGLFGASILGPLILAAIFSLSGLLNNRPPAEIIWAAQYFIAIGIGVKYVGISVIEIRRDILAGFGFSLLLLFLTTSVLAIVLMLNLAEPVEAILSFAPGGQGELVVLAIIVGADLTFVVAHHLLRIFFVILGAPIIASLLPLRYKQ
tara:strand:+ start:5082 stop:6152 length:1071 start_codon:yes stop_codon:yes gene_type:complete